jgi:hypothetical protein
MSVFRQLTLFGNARNHLQNLHSLQLCLVMSAMILSFQNCTNLALDDTDSSSVSTSSASSHITLLSTPSDTSVAQGSSTTLTVSARSKDGKSISYQWYFAGAEISGATSSQLVLSAVSESVEGSYWAVVTDGTYSLATYAASLTVYSPSEAQLSFTGQPSAKTLNGGDALYLESGASDNIGSTITYQWYRNGSAIAGATSSEYYVARADHATDTGYYYVRASNGYTSIKSSTVYVSVSISCTSGTLYYGHCYVVHTSGASFADATNVCASAGGHLVKIESSAENSFVTGLVSSTSWIGASDQVIEGTFLWRDGAAATFTNWLSGQPDNSNNEDCASLQTSGGWNDLSCSTTIPYVCEFE